MQETHDQLVNAVLAIQQRIFKQIQPALTPAWLQRDISIPQLRVLFTISHKGPITIGAIAEASGIGLPTASHLVEKLVQSKLARRSEDPDDRRHTRVHLTAEGEELIGHVKQDRHAQLKAWLQQMNDEDLTALKNSLGALSLIAIQSSQSTDDNLSKQKIEKSSND